MLAVMASGSQVVIEVRVLEFFQQQATCLLLALKFLLNVCLLCRVPSGCDALVCATRLSAL